MAIFGAKPAAPVAPAVEPSSLELRIRNARRKAAACGDTARATYGTPQYAFRKREWLKAVDECNALADEANAEREKRAGK